MKKFTQQEFDALPVVGGWRQCPTGNYSGVRNFGSSCNFGNSGSYCNFGSDCTFGSSCNFGSYCNFGSGCTFGSSCTFEKTLEVQEGYPFLTFGGGGSANRTVYFYNTPEVHVRAGCFLGTLNEFRVKVLADCPDVNDIKCVQYLGMANIAAATYNPTLIN